MYATLADARADNKATITDDDPKLLFYLRTVSRRIDREFQSRRPIFEPYKETRRLLVTPERVSSYMGTLKLDGSLLEVSGVTVGSTTLTPGTNVEGWPDSSIPPFPYLRLTACDRSWYGYCTSNCDPLYVTISGVWGIHRDYANAWWQADALSGAINSSVTTLTVSDVDGADLYGITPRISAGNLLKIDSEFMEVTATNTGTNVVSVRRGVNGTTAAAHDNGAPVYVWQVEEAVRRVTARQAAMMNARRGAYNTVQITDIGQEIRFEPDFLAELRAVLNDYAYGG